MNQTYYIFLMGFWEKSAAVFEAQKDEPQLPDWKDQDCKDREKSYVDNSNATGALGSIAIKLLVKIQSMIFITFLFLPMRG